MATIIIEDGSIVDNANCYTNLILAAAYFDAKIHTEAWDAAADELKTQALITATNVIDNIFYWRGVAMTTTQPLQWPRGYAYNNYNVLIDSESIPINLINAVHEQAFIFISTDTISDQYIGISKVRVADIEVVFDIDDRVSMVSDFVKKLLAGLGSFEPSNSIRIYRS